jgi:PAS domain S-box-containing protein
VTTPLEHLSLPTMIVRDFRITFANEAFCELVGASRERVVGMGFPDFVAPEDVERVVERHARRVRGQPVPDVYEMTLVRGDGTRRHVEIHVRRVGDEAYGQFLDLTAKVERQRNLHALARLGAQVQHEIGETAVLKRVGRGLSALGARGVRFERVVAGKVPGGADPWPTAPQCVATLKDGFVFVDDVPTGTETPSERETVSSGAVLRVDERGRPPVLVSFAAPWLRPEDEATLRLFGSQVGAALDASQVVRDLERRNAELTALDEVATLAGRASSVPELFSVVAPIICHVAQCFAAALFLLEDDGTHARLVHSYGGPEWLRPSFGRVPLDRTRLGDTVRAGTPRVWRVEDFDPATQVLMRRSNHTLVVSVPMVSRSRVIGVINAVRDTERPFEAKELDLLHAMAMHLAAATESTRLFEDLRRSYDELSRAQAQLVQRERLAALGEMAAAVAHEVRNPLAVIFNALATVKLAGSVSSDVEAMLRMVAEESERIDALVRDLLDLARPAAPSVSGGVALAPLVSDAVASVLGKSHEKVRYELVDAGRLKPVSVDPRQMRQVFVNLTTNALQAMPQGGRLTVRLQALDGGRLSVRFEDTGHGIPAKTMANVFDPFFTTRAQGTGLGLTLVKRIVEAHKGEVRIQSEPNQGTRVELVIPVEASAP